MMRELLQTQLSEQLAPVFERLGRLESERSSEVSAVSALEPPQRMTLARVEARQTGAQVAVPMSVESGFSSGAVAKAALAGRPDEHAQENQSLGGVVAVAEPTNSENQVVPSHPNPAGQGQQKPHEHLEHQGHTGAPQNGVVHIDGVEYAWRLGPEGLKLEKTQKPCQVRAASVADILDPRARSPSQAVTPVRSPKRDREPRTRSESPRRTQAQPLRTTDQLLGVGYQHGFPAITAPPQCQNSSGRAGCRRLEVGAHEWCIQSARVVPKSGLLRWPLSLLSCLTRRLRERSLKNQLNTHLTSPLWKSMTLHLLAFWPATGW